MIRPDKLPKMPEVKPPWPREMICELEFAARMNSLEKELKEAFRDFFDDLKNSLCDCSYEINYRVGFYSGVLDNRVRKAFEEAKNDYRGDD